MDFISKILPHISFTFSGDIPLARHSLISST